MKQLRGHACYHCYNRENDVRMSHYLDERAGKYVMRYLCKNCRSIFCKDDDSYIRDKNGKLEIWEMNKE